MTAYPEPPAAGTEGTEAPAPAPSTTALLQRWSGGDARALDELAPRVYAELHRLARRALARERPGHTLQPTALVHEAYLRLAGRASPHVDRRADFYAVAAQLMRRILVDHARARLAAKRGGGRPGEASAAGAGEGAADHGAGEEVELLALDTALETLGRFDPRLRRLVDLRFFAGLTVPETAAALGVSEATVKRGWRLARAWLAAELDGGGSDPASTRLKPSPPVP